MAVSQRVVLGLLAYGCICATAVGKGSGDETADALSAPEWVAPVSCGPPGLYEALRASEALRVTSADPQLGQEAPPAVAKVTHHVDTRNVWVYAGLFVRATTPVWWLAPLGVYTALEGDGRMEPAVEVARSGR